VPTETPVLAPDQAVSIWALCRDEEISDVLDDPPSAEPGFVYRCYESLPYRCEPGASGVGCMPLGEEEGGEEPAGLFDHCIDNPDDEAPPAYIVGTAPKQYIWTCSGGEPLANPNPDLNPADYDELGYYIPDWEPMPESR
jgi:hypothetical protein